VAGNPVRYAEDVLGVHQVNADAEQRLESMRATHVHLADAQDLKRRLSERIAVRESEVISDERAAHTDVTATAFERYIKTVLTLDADLRAMKAQLLDVQTRIDRDEMMLREIEFDLRRLTGRMEELGGLLRFYAARSNKTNDANTTNNT
jgi:chromosome segregation ATPase